MLTFLRYLWRVAVSVVEILVVIYVLDKAHDRNLTIILAVLGMMYAAIRTLGIAQWLGMAPAFVQVLRSLDVLREAAELPVQMGTDEYKQLEKSLARNQGLTYVNLLSMAALSLVCMYWLFTTL